MLKNKARFIEELNAGLLKIQGVPKPDLIKLLLTRGFETQQQLDDLLLDPESTQAERAAKSESYEYLLSMSIWSLTLERV